MKKTKLEVQKRKIFGRKVKKLRAEGVLPVNIYGAKIKSIAVQVDLKKFEEIYKRIGETGVVDLKVKGEKEPRLILIHNLQLDPVTDLPLHADFHQVKLKEKITVEIPIEMIGEAPAEKERVGILVSLLDSLEVEALPTDLPEKFEVDVSKLEKIDDAIRVKDIKVDEKKIKILVSENEVVVKIEPLAKEEVLPSEEKIVEEEIPEEGLPKEAKPEEVKPGEKQASPEEKKPEVKKETDKSVA